jgi:hypothetical protein
VAGEVRRALIDTEVAYEIGRQRLQSWTSVWLQKAKEKEKRKQTDSKARRQSQ